MAKIRITFAQPQQFGVATVTELTVEADRLLALTNGEEVLNVPVEAVARLDQGQPQRGAKSRERHPNHGKPWTDEDKESLAHQWQEGTALDDLSDHFGRSRSGIWAKLTDLGLLSPDATPE